MSRYHRVAARRITASERDAAVLAAKAGDLDARNALIEDCRGLIIAYLTKTGAALRHTLEDIEDLEQELAIAVIGAIGRLEPGRGETPGKTLTSTVWWAFRGRCSGLAWARRRRVGLHPIGDDADTIPDHRDAADAVELADDRRRLRELIDGLPDREATVMRLRYGLDGHEPLTLKQVGARIGLHKERVRLTELRAIARLARAARGGKAVAR